MTTRALLACLSTLLLSAPSSAAEDAPVKVFAASSLAEVFPPIAAIFEAEGQGRVTFQFEATSRLAAQLEGGAAADVFVAADRVWMERLEAKALVVDAAGIASNRLVVVAPRTASKTLRNTADLALLGRVALGGENVPAGSYARAALTSLGGMAAIEKRIVNGANVRHVLELVARGDVDAGVVYATDALGEPRVKVAFALPASSHPPIVYAAGRLAASKRADAAARFLGFLRSERARDVLAKFGFLPVDAR